MPSPPPPPGPTTPFQDKGHASVEFEVGRGNAGSWANACLEAVPAGLRATVRVEFADSMARVLVEASGEAGLLQQFFTAIHALRGTP